MKQARPGASLKKRDSAHNEMYHGGIGLEGDMHDIGRVSTQWIVPIVA